MDTNLNQSPTPSVPEGASRERKLRSRWWRELRGWQKILLVILAVIFLFVFYVTLDANKYRAMVHVVEGQGRVGFNPTDESLDFGDMSRGLSMIRKVNIQNGTPMPIFVMVWRTGAVSELVTLNRNYFRLNPHQGVKLELTSYIPASAEIDRIYSGRVYIFKIPTFGL